MNCTQLAHPLRPYVVGFCIILTARARAKRRARGAGTRRRRALFVHSECQKFNRYTTHRRHSDFTPLFHYIRTFHPRNIHSENLSMYNIRIYVTRTRLVTRDVPRKSSCTNVKPNGEIV